MDARLRELLKACDDPSGCEVPGGDWQSFDWRSLQKSVEAIRITIAQTLKVEFSRDGQVQDASFHDELFILHPTAFRAGGVVALAPEIAIRFSNFGRLYTIHSSFEDLLSNYPLEEIKTIVESEGWIYVPADPLHEVYDGCNGILRDGNNTWWTRYFDYL